MEDPGADDRICRICHDGEDDGEAGRLFRPCRCSGTMAWVHVECLDTWRNVSSNSDSFFCCDQCHYRYEFGRAFTAFGHGFGDRFTVTRLLGSPCAVPIASVLVLLAMIFAGGFVAQLLAFAGLVAPLHFVAATSWTMRFVNHVTAGSILVGGASVVGFILEACTFLNPIGGFGRVNIFPGSNLFGGGGGGGGRGGGDGAKILLAIAVVVGLLVALRWIYVRVADYAATAARRTQDVVLDYRYDGIGGAETPKAVAQYGHTS